VWVKSNKIKTALDIGPGLGTYYNLFEENGIVLDTFDSVEIWEPYIDRFKLKEKYSKVFLADARSWNDFSYDLVIFGDVLEHMTKEEAVALWGRASKMAKFGVISIPTVHMPQGASGGNPYEIHVKDDWSVQEVLETFDYIVEHRVYDEISVFYANF
jgi:hypothetical protein